MVLFDSSNYKNKKTLLIILIHVITILNIVLINFYYDCKHLIVLIIVEYRLGLVQSRFQQSFVINGNNQATAEYNRLINTNYDKFIPLPVIVK